MYQTMTLPYNYNDLEPYLSSNTINIHYNNHYKSYLNKLNNILKEVNYNKNYSLIELVNNIDEFEIRYRDDILFLIGGVLNHELYFNTMSKISNNPSDGLLAKISKTYGNLDNFKNKFISVSKKLVGSGYTFLVLNPNGDLEIINLSNQDTPYSYNLVPLIALDLWEHSYYLDYQYNRDAYINNFFSVVNFDNATKIYEEQIKKNTK